MSGTSYLTSEKGLFHVHLADKWLLVHYHDYLLADVVTCFGLVVINS